MSGSTIGSAGLHFCARCDRPTRWEPVRGGPRERCNGCGDVYPCRSKACGHVDCERERQAPRARGERAA